MSVRVCVLHAGGLGGDLLEPRGGQDASRATISGLWWEVTDCPWAKLSGSQRSPTGLNNLLHHLVLA